MVDYLVNLTTADDGPYRGHDGHRVLKKREMNGAKGQVWQGALRRHRPRIGPSNGKRL